MNKTMVWFIRQVKRVQLTYQNFLIAVIGIANFINLFLTPLALWGFVPLSLLSYFSLWVFFGLLCLFLGVGLHKAGAFEEATMQGFEQSQKRLYKRQVRYFSANIERCRRMTPEELEQELREATEGLRL